MWRFVFPFVLFANLAACNTTGGELATRQDSGVGGVYTANHVISDHPHHVLYGHLVRVTRDDTTAIALVIDHRRDGVHRLTFREAWQDGRELPYRALSHRVHCGRDCRDNAVGMISLNERMLRAGAVSGFHATLLGRQGSIAIFVPPALFSEALEWPASNS